MKFSCNQQILSKSLNTISKAVSSRVTIPILKGILLQTTGDGQVKMAASDLDISIEKKLPVSIYREGAVVVSAKLFTDIIRKLPNEEVEIEIDDNFNVAIRCLTSEFVIVGQPIEEFPQIGLIKEDEGIVIKKEIIKEMIKKTAFCASIEKARGIIVGVLTEMEEDSLTMVALDGFRMAVSRENTKNKENRKIVIDARIINEIYKILAEEEEEEDINLIIDDKKAVFLFGETRIVSKLLEGEFIKYNEIIPKEYKCRLTVNRAELLDSVERASLMAREGRNNLIKLSIETDKTIITSRSEEGNVREEVFIKNEGENLEIGFNAKYISDVLKAVGDEEIVMEFNTAVSPCMIKPTEGDKYEYLILPVRLSSN